MTIVKFTIRARNHDATNHIFFLHVIIVVVNLTEIAASVDTRKHEKVQKTLRDNFFFHDSLVNKICIHVRTMLD